MSITWDKDWQNIEEQLGMQGLERFINAKVIQPLGEIDPTPETKDGFPKGLSRPIVVGFIIFVIGFMIIESQMPRNTLGTIGSFILFPVLFISTMALTVYLLRHKIAKIITEAQNNFLIRSQILGSIAAHCNMDYVPTPGGTSKALQVIAKWKHCPDKIREVVSLMDAHGGLDVQSKAIRRS